MKRLGEAVLVCFGISVITFLLLHVAGDPVQLLLSIEAKAEDAAILRKSLGLDQPLYIQYGIFLKDLVHLDFGKSLFIREPALDLVLERFPATLQLTMAGMAIALVIAIPLGSSPRSSAIPSSTICARCWRSRARPCPSSGLA